MRFRLSTEKRDSPEWAVSFCGPPQGGIVLALAGGGGISAMMMAGALHPPFSLFLPEEKEKTGRARSKREKEVTPLRGDEGRGTRKACLRFLRMSPARGVVRAGVLEVTEWTPSSFRCRSPGGRGYVSAFFRDCLLSINHPIGAPAGAQRSGSGGERRKEWSRAESSPSGGDAAGGISSDDVGPDPLVRPFPQKLPFSR